jgi:hypothetical protein
MRDWYIAAVAAEYFSHLGAPLDTVAEQVGNPDIDVIPDPDAAVLDAYTYHESWSLLIDALVDAADDLVHAVRDAIARDVEVDSYLTLEAFVDNLLVAAQEHESWPHDTLKIAKDSIRE